ncbi:MAG: Ankyrin, partial [Chthonomonadales bacterium]|nr:Ankyrin [Chthonomonadales bacterium]
QGRSPLENALRTGHSDLVRLLVRRGANVNAAGNTELPPLMTAVSKGSIADVRFLLEKGADATFVSPNGENLLMSVQTPGSLEMVRLLVEHGAPVQGRIKDYNRSVLEILAETADAPMIQYLLEHGAGPDLTTKDSDGETPLAMAARGGNLAVVQLLLAKGGDPNTVDSEGDTPIHHAVHSLLRGVQEESSRERRRAEKPGLKANGEAVEAVQPEKPHNGVAERAAVILLLAKQGAKLEVRNKAGSTPMELALQADSLEALRALQQAGARWPTSQGPKSLLAAAQEDDLDGVRKLLAKGVNPNAADKFGYTPLMLAALRGELEIVRALLLHGAKPDYRVKDENGILLSTPLMLAAEGGHNDIVRLLLKHGANPKIPLADYDWPLYEIVGKGHLQTLRIMLEAGMDVNAGEKAGRTPLMRSVGLIGGAETVHLLLAKGAHVNGKFDRGITPLMKAAEAGRTESIHMLMGAEADIKARSEEGETVLMYAVKSGDIEVVRIVLNTSITAHADINARDKHQKSALSLALDYRFEGIAQALQQAGAKE